MSRARAYRRGTLGGYQTQGGCRSPLRLHRQSPNGSRSSLPRSRRGCPYTRGRGGAAPPWSLDLTPPWAASPARFRQEQSRGRGCDSKSRVVDEREVGGSRAGVEPGGRARLRWNVGPLPPLGRRPLSATPRTCQSPGRVALVCDPSDTLAVLSDSCICVSRITGRVTMPGLPEKRAVVCQDQSGFQGVDVCARPRRWPRGHPCPRFTLG